MKLFHGSNQCFDEILLSKSKDRRDFGKGFYTTTLAEQAESWAGNLQLRFGGIKYLYQFEFLSGEGLKIKQFDGLNEEWLEFIRLNRTAKGTPHHFDIVQGPVANDDTIETIFAYIRGLYSVEEALRRLQYRKANDQISFHTEIALHRLTLIKRTEI
jgi:hypothetical protein